MPALADFLLAKTCRRLNRPPLTFDPRALRAIGLHGWPGNVRELENAVERAVILCDSGTITPELLAIDEPILSEAASRELEADVTSETLGEYFRKFVLEHQNHLSETELARRLGISRKALWEKRQRLGIPRPKLA